MVTNIKTFKIIFKGSLEFGNSKTYEKVIQMYERRLETYYKTDVLLSAEEMFNEETLSLDLPRVVIPEGTEKKWKGTLNLLKYLAQYAVAGSISAWFIDGKIKEHHIVEPHGDKVAVQAYLRGRELIKERGKENEAMEALNKAIQKFERHAQAYERRGSINFQLKNYEDALYDFTKSITIYDNNPDAYFGRANVYLKKTELEKAVLDLDRTVKRSIPLQPVYWKARRIKGNCLSRLGDYEGASREYKMFTARSFAADNPNFKWRKDVFNKYGKVLLEAGSYKEAIIAFNEAMKIEEAGRGKKKTSADELLHRGIALQKAGQKGFKSDWKKAAALGNKKAAKLMEEYA